MSSKKPTAQFKRNVVSLDRYSSTNALNQTLMTLIKSQYENRDITNIKTAKSALDLLESNDLSKFQRKFATMVKAIPIKQTKQKARKEVKTKKPDEELAKVVKVAERRVYRPNIKTKHWESESPSSEVVFKKDFTLFDEAWKAGYPLLVKIVIAHMEQKHPNVKLYRY